MDLLLAYLQSTELNADALIQSDSEVMATDYDDFDYDLIAKNARLIVDTRGKFEAETNRVIRA